MPRILILAVSLALFAAAAPEPTSRPRVLKVDVHSAITGATQELLAAALERARTEHDDALLVALDTPGGYLEPTRQIVQGFLASEVPIIVYVSPAGARAGSAGVFITLAAHVAAMNPSSNIGAAHPVTSNGGDVEHEAGKDMAKKIENDTAAFARSIAKTRGRNLEWAENAVRESVSVTAEEALKLKVIDVLSPSVEELLSKVDGREIELPTGRHVLRTRGAQIQTQEMTVRQNLLALLSDPNLAALLMMLGFVGIGLELYHPGSLYPGIVGGLALLLGLVATQTIPVNLGAMLLLLVGAGLLVSEAYVSSHGLAGAAGAACMLLGTMLFIDKSSPDYRFDPKFLTLSPLVVWPMPVAMAAIMMFVAFQVARSRRMPLVAGTHGLVGQSGEALSEVGPAGGEVFVHGEYWKAKATAQLAKGARIRVVSVNGLIATVVPE